MYGGEETRLLFFVLCKSGLRKTVRGNMKKTIFILSFLLVIFLGANPVLAQETFVPGTDYTIIDAKAQPQKAVSVIEFFNYGCPWCSLLNPTLEAWLKAKPAYVQFSRIPLAFEEGWDSYAKAYYIAVALDIESRITPALFLAIHGNDNRQNNDFTAPQTLIDFFVAHGADRATVTPLFKSANPTIDAQVKNGQAMMRVYNVYEMPAFIVADKYRVSLGQAKTPDRLIAILKYLVTRAHQS